MAIPGTQLRLTVGDIVLAPPTDAQLGTLARIAATPGAVLPSAQAHFVKWLAGRTPDEIEQQRVDRVRSNRDLTKRPGWTLDFAVFVGGEPIGLQSVSGLKYWPRQRLVGTTSWLAVSFQRRGIGTAARAAVLELAFAALGATAAKTWALLDNASSAAVSSKLGYRLVDSHVLQEDGREFVEQVYEIGAPDWLSSAARRRYAPAVTGADEVTALLDV